MRITTERFPEIYLEESRDFQLLARLWNMLFLGKYHNAKTILQVLDPMTCPEQYLDLLRDRLGFEPKIKIEANDMRIILAAFPWLIKNKGSMKSIDAAIRISLLLNGIDSNSMQLFVNGDSTEIQIFFDREVDMSILAEIFRHIAPVGFTFSLTLATSDELRMMINGDSVVFTGLTPTQTTSSLKNQPNTENIIVGSPAMGNDSFIPTKGYGECLDTWAVSAMGIQEITDDEVNSNAGTEGNIMQFTDSGELPTTEEK